MLNVEYASGEAERLNLPSTAEGTSVKLFVGGVPLEMTDEDLRDFFSSYGQVTECHILPQKTANPAIQTKAAFIRFARRADGEKAMETLDKKVSFPGVERTMDVRIAEGKNDAKLDDRPAYRPPMRVPPTHTPSRLQQYLNFAPPIAPIPVPPMRHPRTIGAWTEYYAPDGRPYYHNAMTGVTSWDTPIEFRVAGPPMPPAQPAYPHLLPSPGPAGANAPDAKGPAGCNLFVFHVPTEWTESDLFSHFSQFGNLISYRIAREKESNRPKGFAFVSFDNAGSASAAIAGLNGMIVGTGKRLKVSLKKGEEGGGMPNFSAGFPLRTSPY